MTNVFKKILKKLPKNKIKVVPYEKKDQNISDQLSEIVNYKKFSCELLHSRKPWRDENGNVHLTCKECCK